MKKSDRTENQQVIKNGGTLFLLTVFIPIILIATSLKGQKVIPEPFRPDTSVLILSAAEPDYPPYSIVNDKGEPYGFSVELFFEAAAAAGLKTKMKIGIWDHIMKDLEEGIIDALPLVGRTPEREDKFDFTMPYLTLHGAVFVRKKDNAINTMDDLGGKSIIVMKGDNAEEYVRRTKLTENIILTHTYYEAFQLLAAGEHDAVITQRVLGENILNELKINSIKPLDILSPNLRQDFCFAVRKGNTELLSLLNEGLSIVIANKKYNELHQKWFGPELRGKVTAGQIFKVSSLVILPFLVITSTVMIVLLRAEVRRRTRLLTSEIEEHRQTEKELISLKSQLEVKVEEKTRELNKQVEKLTKSQKAMLFMVEDLNDLAGELKEERSRLQAMNEELESFSYSVSHDLRAPLRAIDGFSNIMNEEYGNRLDDEGRRLLKVIRENSQKMDRLISDLLTLSRVTRSELSLMTIDMSEMAASVFDETADSDEIKTVTLVIDALPKANADPNLLKQVWSNLISNSLKYSRPKKDRRIEITGLEEEESVTYYVKDNGVGFNPEYSAKLFDTFQRLHGTKEFEGTGIGLSIVQRIILRHGGAVGGHGTEGEGATFWFSIPKSRIRNSNR